MNRQIKFRGKSADGRWIYGYLADMNYINNINEVAMPCEEVDPSTIGQFTGLTDKNGTEIYEGDIIAVRCQYPRIVLWDKVSWALMPVEFYHDKHFWEIWEMNLQFPDKEWWEDFAKEIEVIGNIHDDRIKEE